MWIDAVLAVAHDVQGAQLRLRLAGDAAGPREPQWGILRGREVALRDPVLPPARLRAVAQPGVLGADGEAVPARPDLHQDGQLAPTLRGLQVSRSQFLQKGSGVV